MCIYDARAAIATVTRPPSIISTDKTAAISDAITWSVEHIFNSLPTALTARSAKHRGIDRWHTYIQCEPLLRTMAHLMTTLLEERTTAPNHALKMKLLETQQSEVEAQALVMVPECAIWLKLDESARRGVYMHLAHIL
jgi:hypothetical protein